MRIFLSCEVITVYTVISWCSYKYFHFELIDIKAAINIHIQVFVWTQVFISLGQITRSEIVSICNICITLCKICICNNIRNWQMVFQTDYIIFSFPLGKRDFQLFHVFTAWYSDFFPCFSFVCLFVFLILDIPIGMECYLLVI